jgi:nucleoside-diphosphate-sugar epimerase
MSKRVLVTGGAGFIGVALVERLMNEGHRVVVLDNLFRGQLEHLQPMLAKGLLFVNGDVTCLDDLQQAHDSLGGIDLVHHLAAINGTKWFHEAAMMVIDVNINGTLRALECAKKWGARFVFASSPEAFGDETSMPLLEHHMAVFPPASEHQRFSYGASKYLGELAVHHAVREGLDARIVRPFNAYGEHLAGDAYGQVVAMMMQAVLKQHPIAVHGDGLQTRSFTHIDDIIDGFYRAGELAQGLNGSTLAGASFNIGSPEETTVLELAHAVNATVGSMAVDVVLGGGYPGDSRRRVPDCTASKEQLGWTWKIPLEAGLTRMWSNLQP